MVSCTRFFLYKFLAPNIQHSSIPYKKLACTWLEWWALIGRLPIAGMFSFCCVDVVDNLLYKVNIVCLLIYFLNLFKLFKQKFCVPIIPWSGRRKVLRKLFVSSKNARFHLICRQPNLHKLARKFDARNLRKFLLQVSCASLLTVCHHH